MFVPLPLFLSLAANCAPTVAPETLQAVVRIESGFESLAVGVNGEPDVQVRASTIAEASGEMLFDWIDDEGVTGSERAMLLVSG